MNIVLSYYDYENAFEELGAIMIPDTRFNDNDEEERRINFYIYVSDPSSRLTFIFRYSFEYRNSL